MKKIVLFLLFLFYLNSLSFAKPVKLDAKQPDSFIGTYDIVFFYSKAPFNTFTNNVDTCINMKYGNHIECRQNFVKISYGRAQIRKNKNGKYIFENAMQLNNKRIYATTPDEVYMYTKYSPATITGGVLNGDGLATGYTGRNIVEEIKEPNVNFNFTAKNNMLIGNILVKDKCTKVFGNKMNIKSINIVMHLKKVSDRADSDFKYRYKPVLLSDEDRKIFASYLLTPDKSFCEKSR